jgi:myo-inositol 2-dehydrogenase/D-chiro-inositol 1-dehydrogenase
METQDKTGLLSRRDFLKSSAASAALLTVGSLPIGQRAWAAGSDVLKVGVVGCGGRGSGAAMDCLKSSDGVKVVALGDLFQDRVDGLYNNLTGNQEMKDKVDLSRDRVFTGFDAYKKVIDSGVDLVILASPPGFRPSHLKYAVEQGKHVFME